MLDKVSDVRGKACCLCSRLFCADRFDRADQQAAGAVMGTILRDLGTAHSVAAGTQSNPEACQVIVEKDCVGLSAGQFERDNGLGCDLHGSSSWKGSIGEARDCFPVTIADTDKKR